MRADGYASWILENLTTAVVVLDPDLRLITMNPAAESLFAISLRQARRTHFKDLAVGAESILTGLQRCLEGTDPYTERELHLLVAGDRAITVDCMVSPLLNRNDEPVELLIELQQIDRQLRINREEHLVNQVQTTRALVRNLAHEIKNPLGGLRGAAQLLEREFTDDSLKDYTRIIIGEADRLRNLVDRMLGPNQLPDYRWVNIHEVLERVYNLVGAEIDEPVLLERDYDPSIPLLWGDHDQLVQTVLNIVRNAVQALNNQPGTVILRSRVQRQCTVNYKRYKLAIRVDIIDDGPGVPESIKEEIFYPMISGRPDGTGLGLSIAQNLIGQHEGLIECNSRVGETIFSILLPLEDCCCG